MRNDEIVVGGVYAVVKGYTELFHITHVTVDKIEDNYDTCHCQSEVGEMFVSFRNLEKQIGYDAAYSDEYLKWKQRYNKAVQAFEACETIINYEHDEYDETTEDSDWAFGLQQSYQADKEVAQAEMDKIIKAKSWMKEDSHEQR